MLTSNQTDAAGTAFWTLLAPLYLFSFLMYSRYMAERDAQSERMRAQIVEVTAGLLAGSTTGQVSTRAVCDAAGVTPPTLYHHFGDKHGLLHAVVADGFERYLVRKKALPTTGDVLTDFRRGWDMHVEFGVTNPALYNVMYGQPLARQAVPAARSAHAELVSTMRDIEAAGRLRLPVDVATDTAEAAAIGVTLQLIRTDAPSDHPMVTVVRDAVADAVIGPPRDYGIPPVSPQVADSAARLRAALPHGPIATLRSSETALLHDWLDELIDSPGGTDT
jgi:AcrR family transcriptional regulator